MSELPRTNNRNEEADMTDRELDEAIAQIVMGWTVESDWMALFGNGTRSPGHVAYGPKERAICLAALAAMRGKGE